MGQRELGQLRADFTQHLAALLGGARAVALVDFPNHTNCGDSLIWLGEVDALRRLGVRVGYVGSRRLRAEPRVGSGTDPVLCHGGGNFGDIDRRSVKIRAQVVDACADRPVIFLPQSIHYTSPQLRDEDAARLRVHRRLTVMVRDEPSLAQAEAMGLTAVLTPDAAFGTDAFAPRPSDGQRPGGPCVAAIWRTDKEVAAGAGSTDLEGGRVRRADWLPGNRWPHAAVGAVLRATHVLQAPPAQSLASLVSRSVAAYEVDRARRLLAGTSVLATDRLHAAVLGLMLGKRVVWVDNSYGKLSAVLGRWVPGEVGHERCATRSTAEARALEIADSLG